MFQPLTLYWQMVAKMEM